MAKSPRLTRRPISYVQTVGAGQTVKRHGYVFCSSQTATVSTNQCIQCPRFVKDSSDAHEGAAEIHCHGGEVVLTKPTHDGAAAIMLSRVPVSALMTRSVVCVGADLSLDEVQRLFLESGLKAIPVVRDDGSLLGSISRAEVAMATHLVRARLRSSQSVTVGELKLPPTPALLETASVTQAAAVMASEGQQRVAILSASGHVVGIVSASDVLYLLARSEGQVVSRSRPEVVQTRELAADLARTRTH